MKRLFFLALLGAVFGGTAFNSIAATLPKKKLLVVTTTLGFRHSSIETAQKVIASLGESSGTYEVELAAVPPSDPPDSAGYKEQVRGMLARKLAPGALKQYEGVVFANTTGDLPLPDPEAFIQWIREGGAFIGVHSASDTLHGFRPYIEMLGGEFDYHRDQVTIAAINRDASHPANGHLGATWNLDGKKEEIYVFKNFQGSGVHELISLDRHPNTGEPGLYPISWCREFGKGRVFYTALGHNDYVWEMPAFQRHLLGGIEWALKAR
jgi:type 1 glutamine amidotransferase